MGVLTDHGCTSVCDETSVICNSKGDIILTGHQDPATRLWMTPFPKSNAVTMEQAVLQEGSSWVTGTQAETVAFYHAAMESPVEPTLIQPSPSWVTTPWPDC